MKRTIHFGLSLAFTVVSFGAFSQITSSSSSYSTAVALDNIADIDGSTISKSKANGCDTLFNFLEADTSNTRSGTYTLNTVPYSGFEFGHHDFQPLRIVQRYENSSATSVMGARINFPSSVTASPTGIVKIIVYNNNSGSDRPGAEVYSESLLIADIVAANDAANTIRPNSYSPTIISFDQPVLVNADDFYVGIEISYANADDKVCVGTQTVHDKTVIRATALLDTKGIYYFFDGTAPTFGSSPGWKTEREVWYLHDSADRGYALHIFPWTTSTPPRAVIDPVATVCQGETIAFNGSNSDNASSYIWTISGSDNPTQTIAQPSAAMTQSGTQQIYLSVTNSCGFSHQDSVSVVISDGPDVEISSAQTVLCPGDAIDLVASGATTYEWTGDNLSCTSCFNPTAMPTASETEYVVIGSIGNCDSDPVRITINIDQDPVASFIPGRVTGCVGGALDLDATTSQHAAAFAWELVGADANGSLTNDQTTVTYNSEGDFDIKLTVTNSCNVSDTQTKSITVKPVSLCSVSIDENTINEVVSSYFNVTDQMINVSFGQTLQEDVTIELVSLTGQALRTRYIGKVTEGQVELISTSDLAPSVYLLKVTINNEQKVTKLSIH